MLLQCEDWDPTEVSSPLQSRIPHITQETNSDPFVKALPMSVEINVSDKGQVDCYIDDITTVTIEQNNNSQRANAAVLLAIHILDRPTNDEDPITRVDLVSLSKLTAEATLEEQKVLLGWKLDTRSLSISLPPDKHIAWSNNIHDILKKKSSTFSELETLIGRLGHVTFIIPYAKYFMSRLRSLLYTAKHKRSVKIPSEIANYLNFHLEILDLARKGMSMNLLTYRKVDILYQADACPAGLGGYSARGRTWHSKIPKHLQL